MQEFGYTASIVVHDTPVIKLQQTLECLLKSSVNKIYVIDNSDSDHLKSISELDSRIIYKFVENKGYGAGHNIAVKEVIKNNPDGYHLVLNPDLFWEGDVVKQLLEYLQLHPKIGLIAPKIYYPDGSLQHSCRLLPTPIDLIGKRFLPNALFKRLKRYLLKGYDHTTPINCPYLMGCFMLFRNKALIENGVFDERFFMYPEDIDITRRMHKNWETIYFPEVSVVHEHQQESKKNFRIFLIHAVNMVRYFNKWGWFLDSERKTFNKKLLQAF